MPKRDIRTIRVVAADDSAVMREVLRMVFALHANSSGTAYPRMELCGIVKDGIEALEAVRTLRPDVLLLDVEMPRLGGLGVLEHLKTVAPGLPVIMCSAHTERGARVTLDALTQGAKDYLMKPAQQSDFASALDTLMSQLLPKIAALAGSATVQTMATSAPPPSLLQGDKAGAERVGVERAGVDRAGDDARVDVVVIGVSTGGPLALEAMLPLLPKDLGVPVMIVQHMPKLFTGALAGRLHRICQMPVLQARDGMRIEAGQILLAPGDAHMEMVRGAGKSFAVKLHQGPALNSCKPSADYLFQSAAKLCGAGTLALVMTGMGADGLDGARSVRAAGGAVLAQDEETSAVWGMPGRVVHERLASATLPLGGLAEAVTKRVAHGRGVERTHAGSWRPSGVEAAYGMH